MKSSSRLCIAASLAAVLPLRASAAEATAADFARHFSITSNFALGDETLADFPILVRLSESAIQGFAYADFRQPNGADLRFVDSEGRTLSHEVQSWDPSGESLVWVKIPELAAGTIIYAYYGTALDVPSTPADTWTAYAGVWHFDEGVSGGTSYDSTTNHFDGVNSNEIHDAGGVVGRAREMAFPGILLPGTTDFVLGPDFSFSGWVYHNDVGVSWDHLFYRKNASGDENGFATEINGSDLSKIDIFGAWNNKKTVATGLTTGKWYYLTITYGGERGEQFWLYNNGELVASDQIWWQPPHHVALPIAFGGDSDQNDGSCWHGRFDEFRMRTATPTATWAKAEYASMADASSLLYGGVSGAEDKLFFGGNPTVSWDGGSVFTFHASLQSGVGDILSIIADTGATGLVATAAVPGTEYSATLAGLDADTCYAFSAIATNAAGDVASRAGDGLGTFLTGEISVEKLLDGYSETGRAMAFAIHRPANAESLRRPLAVSYTLGGTAVAGTDYTAPAGSIVLPAGSSRALVQIPVLPGAASGATVTLSIAPGSYKTGSASSATATVFQSAETRNDLSTSDFARQFAIQSSIDLGGETLAGFPVLVRLGSHIPGFSYADFQQDGGADLCFFDGTGRILPYEIETWDPTGTSLVWVLAPTFTDDTLLYACYGLDRAVPNTPADVWSGFAGVWHFDGADAAGMSPDATANLFDAQNASVMTDAEGVVAGARAQEAVGDAGDRGIVVPATSGLAMGQSFTVSGWVCPDSGLPGWAHVFYRKNASGDSTGWASEINNTSLGTIRVYGSNGSASDFPSGLASGTWTYLSLVYDGKDVSLFGNGRLLSSQTFGNAVRESSCPISFGIDADRSDNPWVGRLDECRVRLEATGAAARATADYEVMANIDSLDYGVVQSGGIPMLSGAPVVERIGAKAYAVSAALGGGSGELLAVCNDAVTNSLSAGIVSGPHAYEMLPLTGLADGTCYLVSAVATNAAGAVVRQGNPDAFLLGDISVKANGDVNTLHRFDSSFTVSRPDTEAACLHDLTVNYTVSGTAVAGTDFADIFTGTLVLPAGVSSVTLPVALLDGAVPGGDLTLSITPGLYEIGADGSATMAFSDESLLESFTLRIPFTVQGLGDETTTLTDFPVLVRLGPETIPGFRYGAFHGTAGASLVFADADGRIIPHEVDTWNPAGESLVWVKVPTVADGTVFYAYYGAGADVCARLAKEVRATDTWSDYTGVWHLNETGDANAPVYDATANGLDGTAGPYSTATAAGVLGRCRRISTATGNGSDKGRITIPYKPAMDLDGSYTASWWCYGHNYSWTYFIGRKDSDSSKVWGLQIEDNRQKLRIWMRNNWSSSVDCGAPLENGFWYKMTVVYSSSANKVYLYIDGDLANTIDIWDKPANGTDPLYIGGIGSGWGTFDGEMDEVRLRPSSVSAEWVKAEYAQETDASFLLYGAAEMVHPATILIFR